MLRWASEDLLQLKPEEAGGDGFYYAWVKKPRLLRTPSGLHSRP